MGWEPGTANRLARHVRDELLNKLSRLPGEKVIFAEEETGVLRFLELVGDRHFDSAANVSAWCPLDETAVEQALKYEKDEQIENFVFILGRRVAVEMGLPGFRVVESFKRRTRRGKVLILYVPSGPGSSFERFPDSLLSKEILDDVLGETLDLGFLAIEDDLLTLDWKGSRRELWLIYYSNSVNACAHELVQLENLLGTRFTVLRSVGDRASRLIEKLAKVGKASKRTPPEKKVFTNGLDLNYQSFSIETDEVAPTPIQSDEGNSLLLVMDRSVDIVTPLLTQWTYEGMLDEVFEMRNSVLEVEKRILQGEAGGPSERKTAVRQKMTNADPIFRELRDLNFAVAINKIGNVATGLRDFYATRPRQENADINEVKKFVEVLGSKKDESYSASMHTALAEEISARTFEDEFVRKRFDLERQMVDGNIDVQKAKEFLLECTGRQESLYSQLRMLLLWKFTNGPIPDHAANEISIAVHRAYPFGMWSSFDYADTIFDYITRHKSPSRPSYMKYDNFSWLLIKSHWDLVHDYDPDEKEHGEEAPYSGFIPLSAKIMDCGLRERKFPSSVQQTIAKKPLVPGGQSATEKILSRSEAWPNRAVIVVLGGVTRSELSAMRAVIKNHHPKMRVLFAPTSIITGDEFIESSIYEVRGW
mmetsp:Transcript_38619/g.152466  ORF Transcript_38619/g.152466 Transcript_38619/m.152466 type:complete len:648 (-) Transcript_38619:3467-5410(-)